MKQRIKNKRLKAVMIVLSILLLIVLGLIIYLYFIGEPIDGAQLSYTTSVEGKTLSLEVHSFESAVALRGWSFEQKGDTLYIHARKVLVSPVFSSGTFQTTIDLEGIETIFLGGQMIPLGS